MARVIPPLAITDAMLTSSSVDEPDAGSPTTEAVYAGGSTYALGDIVIILATHKRYSSLQGSNTGHAPASNPDWWFDLGYSNKWSMFDLTRNVATSCPLKLKVVVTPGQRVDSLGLTGIVGNSATITMSSATGGGTVYTATEDLDTRDAFNGYDYCFKPFSTRGALVKFDLPPYTDCVITVEIDANSGNAECAGFYLGLNEYVGEAEDNPVSDVINMSLISRDQDTGVLTLTPRPNIPKASFVTHVDKSLNARIRALRDAVNGSPALYCGIEDDSSERFESLLIGGLARTFRINETSPDEDVVTFELEATSS